MCVVLLAVSPCWHTRFFTLEKSRPGLVRWETSTCCCSYSRNESPRVVNEKKSRELTWMREREREMGAGNIHEPLQANLRLHRKHRRRFRSLIELGSLNKYLKFRMNPPRPDKPYLIESKILPLRPPDVIPPPAISSFILTEIRFLWETWNTLRDVHLLINSLYWIATCFLRVKNGRNFIELPYAPQK